MVVPAVFRGNAPRVAAGARRSFSIGVTRPSSRACSAGCSSMLAKPRAAAQPASLNSSPATQFRWKPTHHVRSYATEGSAPPADQVGNPIPFPEHQQERLIRLLHPIAT